MKFTLATRGSALALWQANETKRLLLAAHPDWDVALHVVQSAGDKDHVTELARFGLTGIFTAEVDHAVLSGAANAGVHSLKDMTTSVHEGLMLASTLGRAPAEDVLVGRNGMKLADLAPGARVATGSVRRVAMLRALRPDLEVVGIRGNVDTRIKKLHAGECDALIMARAGLVRIGLAQHITEVFDKERFVPAVGQGIVGITCRRGDAEAAKALGGIADVESFAEAMAERALLHALHGGCNAPVGGHARAVENAIVLHARVLSLDGREVIEDRMSGELEDAAMIGGMLAERLNERGAKRLIEAARVS